MFEYMCGSMYTCKHHMPIPNGYPIISHADLSLEKGSTSSKVVDVKRGQLKDEFEPTLAKAKS